MNDHKHHHEASAPVKTEEAQQEVIHAHTHKHADGTVHSHYHRHAGGDVAHSHANGTVHSHADGTVHHHEGGECAHSHTNTPADSQALSSESLVAFDTSVEAHSGMEVPLHDHDAFAAAEPLLIARNLAFAYPRADHPVFQEISFDVQAGSMLAILGNNGAGKSTLLDLLSGIATPTMGSVQVCGKDLAKLDRRGIAQRIAYVTQQQTVPHLSVYDEVLLGRRPHLSWSISQADRDIVANAITELGLEGFAKRYCDELSGGERQKVFIARALAQEPQVMILDEPTSALDPKNQLEVLRVIRAITRRNNIASVLVIHDINLALRFCDRFILMRNGAVVAAGGHEAVTDEALSQTYDTSLALIEAQGTRLAIPQ